MHDKYMKEAIKEAYEGIKQKHAVDECLELLQKLVFFIASWEYRRAHDVF